MGPQNVVAGDADYGTELPQTERPPQDLTDEKNMAKFSKTAEFKRLEEYAKGRIEFYQKYMPNGEAVLKMTDVVQLGQMWMAASVVVGEFNALLSAYKNADEVVKENARREVS